MDPKNSHCFTGIKGFAAAEGLQDFEQWQWLQQNGFWVVYKVGGRIIMKWNYTFRVVTCLLLLSFGAKAQDAWKLKTDKDGVQVYMQSLEETDFKPVKTVTTFKASLSSVAAVLLDVNSTPDWVYGTKSGKLLKQESATSLYYHAEMSMPWPVSNRDFIIHISMSQNEQTKVITVLAENKPSYMPPVKGVVRIQRSSGKWTISPLANGMVKVEYVLQVDPGGNLPAGLVNMFSYNGPYESFRSLRNQVKKPAYSNAQFSFIKD